MRLLLVILALAVSGCSTLDPMTAKKTVWGYRSYDPCIRCGERWQQLPNWEHEAVIRASRGEQW